MDKVLRILYISHYFPPEVNAPAVRVSELAECWAENGAEVTVLTCFPNHPTGVIPPEYQGKRYCREKFGSIDLIRTYVYAAPNRGFLRRVINFLSFMLSAIFIGGPAAGKQDIVIATSPQFFVAVAGYVISRLKGAKFVFEVRDLWPEEIVAVGALKNRLAIHLLEGVEMFLYRKADIIVAVAQGTIEILKRRGVPEEKMVFIPNGVDMDFFSGYADGQPIRQKLGLGDKFVVGYIGTHGMAHRLNTVLEAAAMLRHKKDIHFLFVGDGAEKRHLQELSASFGLKNVLFHNQVSRDRIPSFYSACDICLVPLRKTELFTKNIPSKIYEIMASSRPIIISTEGESKKLVESAGAGYASAPEDSEDMARKIDLLYSRPGLCSEMGKSGYSFVVANYSRKRLSGEYYRLLDTLINGQIWFQPTKQNDRTTDYSNIEGGDKVIVGKDS
jgi:colanic acid biosynthesis glycosyl transferase WcaI